MKTVLRIQKIGNKKGFKNLTIHSVNQEKRKKNEKFNNELSKFNKTMFFDNSIKTTETSDLFKIEDQLNLNLEDVKIDFEKTQLGQRAKYRKTWDEYINQGKNSKGNNKVNLASEVLLTASIDFFEEQGWISTQPKLEFEEVLENGKTVIREKKDVKKIKDILNEDALNDWFKEQVNWYREESYVQTGFDNFLGATLQLDETTPHIQMWFTNKQIGKNRLGEDKVILSTTWTRDELSNIQNEYYKFNNEKYNCFDPITPKAVSGNYGKSLSSYYNSQEALMKKATDINNERTQFLDFEIKSKAINDYLDMDENERENFSNLNDFMLALKTMFNLERSARAKIFEYVYSNDDKEIMERMYNKFKIYLDNNIINSSLTLDDVDLVIKKVKEDKIKGKSR